MNRVRELYSNLRYTWHEEGLFAVLHRVQIHILGSIKRFKRSDSLNILNSFVDVLFINGCDYSVPHPIRYRVNHQAEQLEMAGLSTSIVNAWEITEEHVRIARIFIIFRCPYSESIGHFVDLAHSLNKRVLYDIDDLVIDTKYTDQITFLSTLSVEERTLYDDGVRRMGQTMKLCDGAITTTERLASELKKYLPTVFINRNVASEEMLYLSEKAVYERDVLPNLQKHEIKLVDRHRWKVAQKRKATRQGFSIGYFSGSITHNRDFEMILPAVVRFMRDYSDVFLYVVGELDLPDQLAPFSERIIKIPFSSWRRLPQMLSFVDVNLIPLEDTIFNQAKSENKWVEAALVKVPSIASRVGALATSISHGVDGLLCENTPDNWYEALDSLKNSKNLYRSIACAAYDRCSKYHVALGSGRSLASFIQSQETPNIALVLPGITVSGGIHVALKHAAILQKSGIDVTLLVCNEHVDDQWIIHDGTRIPLLRHSQNRLRGWFDKIVATMWSTVEPIMRYRNAHRRLYLVQSRESLFYQAGDPRRIGAARTYDFNPNIEFCTISPWCQSWLQNDFGHKTRYAPNGIELSLFPQCERDWSGRIRILIEGDSSSAYKNVDESFRIVDKLPKDLYEIWYLSYNGKAKSWYRVDKSFYCVPHSEVARIYQQCHILLKTSILESFSYPPLEMMATGGQVVAVKNEGNTAYLVDGKNSLLFDAGEIDKAVELIELVTQNEALRERLREEGIATAQSLSWDAITHDILSLYD